MRGIHITRLLRPVVALVTAAALGGCVSWTVVPRQDIESGDRILAGEHVRLVEAPGQEYEMDVGRVEYPRAIGYSRRHGRYMSADLRAFQRIEVSENNWVGPVLGVVGGV